MGVGREANNPNPQKNIVTKHQKKKLKRPRPIEGYKADDDVNKNSLAAVADFAIDS